MLAYNVGLGIHVGLQLLHCPFFSTIYLMNYFFLSFSHHVICLLVTKGFTSFNFHYFNDKKRKHHDLSGFYQIDIEHDRDNFIQTYKSLN